MLWCSCLPSSPVLPFLLIIFHIHSSAISITALEWCNSEYASGLFHPNTVPCWEPYAELYMHGSMYTWREKCSQVGRRIYYPTDKHSPMLSFLIFFNKPILAPLYNCLSTNWRGGRDMLVLRNGEKLGKEYKSFDMHIFTLFMLNKTWGRKLLRL